MQTKELQLSEKSKVWYFPEAFSREESEFCFRLLQQEVRWKQDEIKIFGREIITRRKVAWYGDQSYDYRYSGHSRIAQLWTNEMRQVKYKVEELCQTTFNSCLCNLYHDGSEGMGWHSDDEKSLDPEAPIASLSLGASRRFLFRSKENPKSKKEIILEPGSILLMSAECQREWQHSLPVAAKVKEARINLTFRRMLGQQMA
jgi:alkylated DNA repair dioxygenase AlkB